MRQRVGPWEHFRRGNAATILIVALHISGILHRLREGCRWRAVPEVYGPCTTVFNRYNRWSKRGVWQRIFAGLVGCNDPPTVTMIDSTAGKAHRSSAGAR